MKLKTFRNKYSPGTPVMTGVPKHQGWNSTSRVFSHVFNKADPDSVIEVGSWLGQSAIHMAGLMNKPDILCVDVWLTTHSLTWDHGLVIDVTKDFSSVYEQFCANITDKGLNDVISPLPMTSTSAAEFLSRLGVSADLIYIDAGHSKRDVYADLQDWWPMVNTVLVGDDYHPDWPGVMEAADQFAKERGLALESEDRKFILWK